MAQPVRDLAAVTGIDWVLAEGHRSALWVPGAAGTPLGESLREPYDVEIASSIRAHDAPADNGSPEAGSEVPAGLIETYVPWLALVGGAEPAAQEELARTLVAAPGRLADGHEAIGLGARSVEAGLRRRMRRSRLKTTQH